MMFKQDRTFSARFLRALFLAAAFTLGLFFNPADALAKPKIMKKAISLVQKKSMQKKKASLVILADGGVALYPIVVSATASEEVLAAAEDLAEMLEKISGAAFAIQTGDGTTGIAVGKDGDFPSAVPDYPKDASDPHNQEDFSIRTHAAGMYLVGAGNAGARNAVWYFLNRLGYAQFFPMAKWEYVPSLSRVQANMNVKKSPAYKYRGMGGPILADLAELADEWKKKNLFEPSTVISVNAMYQSVRLEEDYADDFALHPEYLSPGNKLCVFDLGLQDLVWDWVMDHFEKSPDNISVSMTPNDGLGDWTCPSDVPGTSTTDKGLYLANTMAERLAASPDLSDKLVGTLAYGDMSGEDPTLAVNEKVRAFPAMSFIQNGRTFEDVVKGWYNAGARQMGFYNYYSVITWSWDIPGTGKISRTEEWLNDLVYYQENYDFAHTWGEHSPAYGPYGLNYWLYTRAAWDPKRAQERGSLEKWKTQFFTKMFGDAADMMKEFYELMDDEGPAEEQVLLSTHLVGKMYSILSAAKAATNDAAVHDRIGDLIGYTRYVELYLGLKRAQSSGIDVETAFIDFLHHARRIELTGMVNNWGLFSLWSYLDTSVGKTTTANILARLGVTQLTVWNSDTVFPEPAYTATELDQILATGTAANPLRTWEPVTFSKNLVVPSAPLNAVTRGANTTWLTGDQDLYVYVDATNTFTMTAKAGRLKQSEHPVLFEVRDAVTGELVFAEELEADNATIYSLAVPVPAEGLYSVTLRNNPGGTDLDWTAGLRVVKATSPDESDLGMPVTDFYFYVPVGTAVLGGYRDWAGGKVYDPDGIEVPTITKDYFTIPVAPEKAGKLWKFRTCYRCTVMTVPAYMALDDSEMLIPAEVSP